MRRLDERLWLWFLAWLHFSCWSILDALSNCLTPQRPRSVRVQACWLPPGGLPTSAVSASSHLYLKRLIELSFSVPRWAPWTPMKRVPPRPRQFRQLPTHAWSSSRNCWHGLHTFPPGSVLFWAQHFCFWYCWCVPQRPLSHETQSCSGVVSLVMLYGHEKGPQEAPRSPPRDPTPPGCLPRTSKRTITPSTRPKTP